MRRTIAFLSMILFSVTAVAQGTGSRVSDDIGPKTVIGPSNVNLQDGASALLAGNAEDGVRLTLRGLQMATNSREEEAALSNLCAGYIMLEKLDEAIKYCDMLLIRNDSNWRAYNNRAVIHIKNREYEKAEQDLRRGEELKPGAHTLKVARAMYMDAVHPVAPEVIVDDRGDGDGDDAQ